MHRYAIAFMTLTYVALLALLFRGFGDMYFGTPISDLTYQFYPWRTFLSRWLGRGVFPFWDPHVFSGYPVLEMQQMGLFNPISIISALLLPPRLSLHAMTAAHIAIALFGTYAGLRVATRFSRTPSAIGAVAFVLGTVFSIRVAAGHFTVVAALAFSPLAIATGYGAVALLPISRGTWRDLMRTHIALLRGSVRLRRFIALAAICNAATVLAGSPQYVVYLFYAQAAGWLLAFPRRWFAVFATLGLTWAIAAALSCPQWFPTLFYLPFTGRGGGSSMTSPGMMDKVNLLLETLLPYPFGDDLSITHLHLKSIWETGSYPGALAIVLLLGFLFHGIARRRISPRGRLGIGIMIIGIYLCNGWWLPGLSSFREALKARAITSIGFAFVAAAALQQLAVAMRTGRHRRYLIGSFSIAAIAVTAIATFGAVYAHTHPLQVGELIRKFGTPFDPVGQPFYTKVQQNPEIGSALLRNAALHVGIFAAAIAAIISLRRRWMLISIFALLAADLGLTNYLCYLSRYPFDAVEFPVALREDILKDHKAMTGRSWRVSLPPQLANRGHLVDGIHETGGYDPIMPRNANNHAALIAGEAHDNNDTSTAVARALGRRIDYSKLYESATSEPDPATVPRVEAAVLATLERNVTAGIPSDMAFGPSMDGTHFLLPRGNPQPKVVKGEVLPEDFRKEVLSVASASPTGKDRLEKHVQDTPNAYSYKLSTSAPAYLVLRTTWLPGWNVRVDNAAPQKPYCANGWMLTCLVPQGGHNVTFYYRPVGIWPTLTISAAASVLILWFVFATWPPKIRII